MRIEIFFMEIEDACKFLDEEKKGMFHDGGFCASCMLLWHWRACNLRNYLAYKF